MQSTKLGIIALLCTVLAACGTDAGETPPPGDTPPPGGMPADRGTARDDVAHLTVEPGRVAAGGTATIRLFNHSDQALGYNLCPASLERRADGDWEERSERPAEACTMELRRLEPGGSADYQHTIPAGLPAGTYRFRVGIFWPFDGDQISIVSDAFEIERAG